MTINTSMYYSYIVLHKYMCSVKYIKYIFIYFINVKIFYTNDFIQISNQ
jgi:hypothetical protein